MRPRRSERIKNPKESKDLPNHAERSEITPSSMQELEDITSSEDDIADHQAESDKQTQKPASVTVSPSVATPVERMDENVYQGMEKMCQEVSEMNISRDELETDPNYHIDLYPENTEEADDEVL